MRIAIVWVALLASCGRSGFEADANPVANCFVPSNVGRQISFDASAASLTVGDTAARYYVFDTDTGAIDAYAQADRTGAGVSVRAPGSGSRLA